MATRRVVLLLALVLIVSSVAAALIPSPPQESTEPDKTHKERSKQRDAASQSKRRGRLVVATFEAAGRHPETVRLRKGDELRMEIGSRIPVQIEISAYGLIEDASPDAPARFDILVDRRGTSAIRTVGSGRIVGRLVAR
jgi:hypothetical protein